MRVLFIAHGATAATRAASFPRDEPLDRHGADDASALSLRWAHDRAWPLNPERATVLAGPEQRCQQTALRLGLGPADTDVALSDWDFGAWAGLSVAELSGGDLQNWLTEPDFAPPGGESRQQLLSRVGTWLDGRSASSRVIAVTHPAVMRAAALYALCAAPEAFGRIDVPPLATLALSGDGRRWNVRLG